MAGHEVSGLCVWMEVLWELRTAYSVCCVLCCVLCATLCVDGSGVGIVHRLDEPPLLNSYHTHTRLTQKITGKGQNIIY